MLDVSYTVKTEEPCVYCGTPTLVRQKWSRAPICLTHSIEAMVAQIRDTMACREKRVRKEQRLYAKQLRERR